MSEVQSRRYVPRAPLSEFVRCLWYWQGRPQPHLKERLLPNGEPSIVFNLCDEPFHIYNAENLNQFSTHRQAVLSGARSDCFVIDSAAQERVAGIQFRPGGLFPFIQMPASDAKGLSIDLNDIWGHEACDIRDQLQACCDVDAMMATLERCLLKRLVRPLALHPAVRYALREFEGPARSIGAVTDCIGLSSRRLIQLFRDQVGLTPKVFSRVRRFQLALETIHSAKSFEWAQLALDCGYYDQAHFIHDFQAFSGLRPSQYAACATPHLNHVPMA